MLCEFIVTLCESVRLHTYGPWRACTHTNHAVTLVWSLTCLIRSQKYTLLPIEHVVTCNSKPPLHEYKDSIQPYFREVTENNPVTDPRPQYKGSLSTFSFNISQFDTVLRFVERQWKVIDSDSGGRKFR